MNYQPPEALVRGCNDPVSIGVLSDWIEEQYGIALDYEQSGWSDGYGFHRAQGIRRGDGRGDAYSFTNGDGQGNGQIENYGYWYNDNDGYGYGYGEIRGDGNGNGNCWGRVCCWGHCNGYSRK